MKFDVGGGAGRGPRTAERIDFFSLMSCCDLLTTPIIPSLTRTTLPFSMSDASVPRSIKSSLVQTPMVRSPAGSTSLAIFNASELAKSEFAGETARMIEFGFSMYLMAGWVLGEGSGSGVKMVGGGGGEGGG